ncbi:hypothetical protein BCR35DRAFT_303119 [Leucosporidium creatinivorum]|uniref:VWFA domain-containing protein n=1 Tax=Leucosporidium creatinivorum TaxID=106004 RepID=A0A1Y2FJF1_9BASI|nr:hypothetical protein BCR35DRAFT_303119 [Leucosporidium creatinivorum]
MGLFSKKSSKPSSSASSYAPPPGPPPQQQQQQYGAPPPQQGYGQGSYNQQYQGGGYQQQQAGYQQQYAPPPTAPPPIQQQQRPTGGGGRGREDPLAALSKYDTVFLIDDSESMEMFWVEELAPALAAVIGEAAKYDTDGVDLHFFNSPVRATSRSSTELLALFQKVWPSKSTPTASALRRVLDPYLDDLRNWTIEGKPGGYPRPKPMNLIVLTDGAPDRGEDPEEVIVNAARRLEEMRMPPYQLGIQFVQIGADDEASAHLTSLDDDLREKHGIRDLVDTTLFDVNTGQINSEYIMKALLGGMNRTWDNQN